LIHITLNWLGKLVQLPNSKCKSNLQKGNSETFVCPVLTCIFNHSEHAFCFVLGKSSQQFSISFAVHKASKAQRQEIALCNFPVPLNMIPKFVFSFHKVQHKKTSKKSAF
jgi:hypothetical protein